MHVHTTDFNIVRGGGGGGGQGAFIFFTFVNIEE